MPKQLLLLDLRHEIEKVTIDWKAVTALR